MLSYAAGALQGFAFSLLAAIATLLAAKPYDLSSTSYGSLFLPELVSAVVGALTAPLIAQRLGTLTTLRIGLAANILALLALLGALAVGEHYRYTLLITDTAFLGLGFGLANSAANELVDIASATPNTAVTMLNVLTGLGTSLSPAIIAVLRMPHLARVATVPTWRLWPLLLCSAFVLTLFLSLRVPAYRRVTRATTPGAASNGTGLLALYTVAAALYGLCEGTFGSWATTFAQRHGASLGAAEASLTGFWLALTATRYFATLAPRLFPMRLGIPLSALFTAVIFVLLPVVYGGGALIVGFVLGGIGCGVIFPYLVANALDAMPTRGDTVTGFLIGGLMVGEGGGSFAVGALAATIGLPGSYRVAGFVALALAAVAMLALRRSPSSTVSASV